MSKALLVDITKCNGCYSCQLSCKDEHVDNDWTPYARPQPNTGHFWWKITETVQGTVPKVRVHYMHEMCQHCENPKCLEKAKNGEVYRRDDGLIIIDPEKARGRRDLVEACPYGAIYWNEEYQLPQKCTGCAHLLDGRDGVTEAWTEPRCVQSCPTDALLFGEYEQFQDKIASEGFEQLHPEYGTGPRVWYKGLLNRFFIAGEVFDPVADEELEGAAVTLIAADGSEKSLKTDVFGDFWFERQEPGVYSLRIEMDGYAPKTIEGIDATKDVNVGPIALAKK